ncbi:hypothetical protein CISG_01225 [Coccidioides immitis RMSCC 3703]|uniref:Uncharacterized protein n=1 Tax=Coccidioides immitis RMSCC 3703 TaxID=454286 RepID=A0A0J8TRV8_COCIT|nr:hypothetical protein CISG_01225 [Coccidioides immitis RMSCC 3703]
MELSGGSESADSYLNRLWMFAHGHMESCVSSTASRMMSEDFRSSRTVSKQEFKHKSFAFRYYVCFPMECAQALIIMFFLLSGTSNAGLCYSSAWTGACSIFKRLAGLKGAVLTYMTNYCMLWALENSIPYYFSLTRPFPSPVEQPSQYSPVDINSIWQTENRWQALTLNYPDVHYPSWAAFSQQVECSASPSAQLHGGERVDVANPLQTSKATASGLEWMVHLQLDSLSFEEADPRRPKKPALIWDQVAVVVLIVASTAWQRIRDVGCMLQA